MIKPYKIHHGKLEDVLPTFEDNSIDHCVTDGPYGIRFMGKAWDYFDIDKKSKQMGMKKSRMNHNHKSLAAGKYNLSLKANRKFQEWFEDKAKHIYRVLKPGGYFISFGSPRTFHRMVSGVEDAGFEIRDTMMWIFSSGFPKSLNLTGKFDGWGSGLKPAYEPILIARKPLDHTIGKNMEEWGTGAINIKATKIPGEPWFYGNQPKLNGARYNPGQLTPVERHAENITGGEDGRWPANVIIDGSEEVVSMFPESRGQQGDVKGTEESKPGHANTYSKFNGRHKFVKRGDIGSAARFFYCPKISRLDRDEGVKGPKKAINWSSGDQNPGSFQSPGTDRMARNSHPTVKPTALMRYLIRLVALEGATILDPFAGSGSTLKAAMLEKCKAVGIEMDEQWIPIIRQRTEFGLRHQDTQIGLF